MRKPALICVLVLSFGIYLGTLPTQQMIFAAAFIVFASIACANYFGFIRDIPILLLVLVTGIVLIKVNDRLSFHFSPEEAQIDSERALVSGIVAEDFAVSSNPLNVVLHSVCVKIPDHSQHISGRVLVTLEVPEKNLLPGDRVMAIGRLTRVNYPSNFRLFNYERYLKQRGIVWRMTVRGQNSFLLTDDEHEWKPQRLLVRLRKNMSSYFTGGKPGKRGYILSGIILGERGLLSRSFIEASQATGTAHILAVSGFHLGIIGVVLYAAAVLSGIYGLRRAVFVIVGLFLYASMVGFRPSVMRAFIMSAVIIPGLSAGKNADPLNALGFAGFFILCMMPHSLFDPGLQLSFVVTFFIIVLFPVIFSVFRSLNPWRLRGFDWLLGAFAVSLAANVSAVPIIVIHFGRIPVLGVFMGMFSGILAGFLIPLGLIGWLLNCLPPLFMPFQETVNILLRSGLFLLEQGIMRVAELPFSSVEISWILPLYVIGFLVLLYMAVLSRKYRLARKVWVFLFLVLINIALWNGLIRDSRSLDITFFDVGQGDSMLIEFPGGRTLLIDGGPERKDGGAGTGVLLPYLRKRGIHRLDVVLMTHPDSDHLGGLIPVLSQCEVGLFLHNGKKSGTEHYKQLKAVLKHREIPDTVVEAGDSLVASGGVGGLFLHPHSSHLDHLTGNDLSVVLRLDHRMVRVLFSGDIEKHGQEYLFGWGSRLKAEILKVPHHGSDSSSEDFFREVSPLISIISVGKNPYGHPAETTIRSLEHYGSEVFRTDHDGAVLLSTNGDKMEIKTARMGGFSSRKLTEYTIFNK